MRRPGEDILSCHRQPGTSSDRHSAFARALEQGGSDELPTGEDGLAATRIARAATEEIIARRMSGGGK